MTLTTPRTQHAATLLPDGATVLVVGGLNSTGAVLSAELFPASGSGASVTVPFPGGSHNVVQSVLLGSGKVLVVGDFAGAPQAWVYGPATSGWTGSTMNARRLLPALILLADGRVLAVGEASRQVRRSITRMPMPGPQQPPCPFRSAGSPPPCCRTGGCW